MAHYFLLKYYEGPSPPVLMEQLSLRPNSLSLTGGMKSAMASVPVRQPMDVAWWQPDAGFIPKLGIKNTATVPNLRQGGVGRGAGGRRATKKPQAKNTGSRPISF